MKPSKIARVAAELYYNNQAVNCCHALTLAAKASRNNWLYVSLIDRFQREFAERVYIHIDDSIDYMTSADLDQFRVFLLLFFAEWLKDRGE